MKSFILASSFVFAGLLSYGWVNRADHGMKELRQTNFSSITDTIPKSKDSLKQKHLLRDSTGRKDTSWPKLDSSGK